MKYTLISIVTEISVKAENILKDLGNQICQADQHIFFIPKSQNLDLTEYHKQNNVKIHLYNLGEEIDQLILSLIHKIKSEYIFLHYSGSSWFDSKIARYNEEFMNGADFVFSDAFIFENEQELSLLDKLKISTKNKLKLIEYKSDEVFPAKSCVHKSTIAFRKTKLISKLKIDKLKSSKIGFAQLLANIYSAYDASKVHFIPEKLVKINNLEQQELEGIDTEVDYRSKLKQLENVLEIIDNSHFKRAHYFWFIRERSKNLPFIQRLISLNTLFLERDYRRNTDRPFTSFISDLFQKT